MPPVRFFCSACEQNRDAAREGVRRMASCGHCTQCCGLQECYYLNRVSAVHPPEVAAFLATLPGPRFASRHTEFPAPMTPEVRCFACSRRSYNRTFSTPTGACGQTALNPSWPCACGSKDFRYTGVNLPVSFVPRRKQLKLNPLRRLIGLEIELDKYTYGGEIDGSVKALNGANTHDGTAASGLEINSAPAGGDLFVENTTKLCDAIRTAGGVCGKKLGRSGLHVHVDAYDLDHNDIRRLILLYSKLEPALFSIIDPRRIAHSGSRPGDRFCDPIGQGPLATMTDPTEAKSDVIEFVVPKSHLRGAGNRPYKKDAEGLANRYRAMNIWSWWLRGTIEFRMHHGTTKWQKIIPWSMLLANLVESASKFTESQVWAHPSGLKGLLAMAPDTSLNFDGGTWSTHDGQTWDSTKDGVRQWIYNRWQYFAAKRKNRNQPIIGKVG